MFGRDLQFPDAALPALSNQALLGPCVDRISKDDYSELVMQARQFLSGKNTELQQQLATEMERASEAMEYERAAAIRDRIRGFTNMQNSGTVNPSSIDNADVVAIWQTAGETCIQVFFIRASRNNGNRAFYPVHAEDETPADVLSAFLIQFYDNKPPPPSILVNCDLSEQKLLQDALSIRLGQKVEINRPQRGREKMSLSMPR